MQTMPTVRRLASVAAMLLLSVLGFAGLGHAQDAIPPDTASQAAPQVTVSPVPLRPMTFKIYNNSGQTLYPVISTGQPQVGKWLQAEFQVPNPATSPRKYQEKFLYRIYINGTDGVPPGGSVTVTLPLWSQLAPGSPNGAIPDQYVDWWSGQRLSFYNSRPAILAIYKADVASNTDFEGPVGGSPVVTCAGCKATEPRVFRSFSAITENQPGQLSEYTVGITDQTKNPYTISDKIVGYNISYVDNAYLPVAIEPLGNVKIGYVGTAQSIAKFTGAMRSFINTPIYVGWPTFLDNDKKPLLKIPSAGFIFAAESGGLPSPDLTTPGASFKSMIANWKTCTLTTKNTGAACVQIRDVQALFLANYASYANKWTAKKCVGAVRPLKKGANYDYNWLLFKVYGWVPFNETAPSAKCAINNELFDTPGYRVKIFTIVDEYKTLQYTPAGVLPNGGAFNPYVELIHGEVEPNKFLGMPFSYAFSIDDAVGFMLQEGRGLVFAVGGLGGLPNPNQYDPKAKVNVQLQGAGGLLFTDYGVCPDYQAGAECPFQEALNGTNNFQIYDKGYPMLVTLMDSKKKLYEFLIKHGPPFSATPSHSVIACPLNDGWCMGINAKTNPPKPPSELFPQNYIETGPPTP